MQDPSPPNDVPDWALSYEANAFAPWSLAADVVAVAIDPERPDLHLIVVRRGGEEPFAGREALPGGFVQWADDADGSAAARRALRLKTGVWAAAELRDLGTYDASGRDPRQFAGRLDPASGHWIATGARVVSRAFLALLRHDEASPGPPARWASVYALLPWEDLRSPHARNTVARIGRELADWAASAVGSDARDRRLRVERLFTVAEWDEQAVRERWDLMLEARLVEEAWRDRWGRPLPGRPPVLYGEPLAFDHRTLLADALAELRRRIRREPDVLRALMAPEFTMRELQDVLESVGGRDLYRTNLGRVFTDELLQPTGRKEVPRGPGKPADYYSFAHRIPGLPLRYSLTLPWTKPTS